MLKPIFTYKLLSSTRMSGASKNLTQLYFNSSIVFPLSSTHLNLSKNFSTSATDQSSSSSAKKSKDSKETLIYEYKNVGNKLRTFFWSNMFYIYGNSILFHFEVFEPTIGYFHGLMLSLSLVIGWGCFLVVGSIAHKTIHRIYKFNDYLGRPKYRVVYLSFYKVYF